MTAAGTARSESETTGTAAPLLHFPGLETLRALAAVMVVVHHASSLAGEGRSGLLATPASVMDGGVAVFFVLSGFLIYRPFVAAHLADGPAQRWRSFWWRRVLRIVPAYWVVLSFFWAVGSFDLGPDWWRYYLFLQIYSPFTAFGGVVQAWSLCTEMSFYVVVPLFAAGVARATARLDQRGRALAQLGAVGVVWCAGPVARFAIERWLPSRRGISFNWLPTNLDLFATGMALAVVSAWAAEHAGLRRRLDRAATPVWAWWGPAVALFAWYAYAVGAVAFDPGYAGWFWHRRQFVLALVTLLLLVPAVFGPAGRGLIRRAWGWRPLAWVGTVSYGLYLWHLDWMERSVGLDGRAGWIDAAAGDAPFAYLLLVGLGLGGASAAASWYLLERPSQRFKRLVDH